MNIQHSIPHLLAAVVLVCAVGTSGCSKKEPAKESAPANTTPATPAAQTPAAVPAAQPSAQPAATKADSPAAALDMVQKQMQAPAAAETSAAEPAPKDALPASVPAGITGLKSGGTTDAMTTLSASAGALQKQAEDLLAQYSGELATVKTGFLAVKNYVDQHPDMLPEAAKGKYQQLNALMPQLESLVSTLKDYRSADMAALVPKLQNDFAKAKSLYAEVRALLPENL